MRQIAVARIFFEPEHSGSAVLSSVPKIEEIRADSISVKYEYNHVVFNAIQKYDTGRLTTEVIGYLATDIKSFTITNEDVND